MTATTAMTAPIEIADLACRLGGREVLAGITLRLEPGETLALLGPSGAGKSTLLRAILGLLAPSAGEVHIGGRLASAAGRVIVPPEERRLGMVFQDLALWPHLTVAGNLRFVLRARRLERADEARAIAEALESVGLAGLAERYPAALSGGERQRVAVARALVARPRAVLLDEPLANLDVALRAELVALFRTVLRDAGVPAVHVTHDPAEALALAHRVAVVEAGRIAQLATPTAIAASPSTAFAAAVAGAWRAGR
ncbi:MAG TPA: ABC transporter ATP-binding protein [Candidatus Acidoferrum sp.]|nr:ABC transporter ATP-binding protein [Candidatus Acidoferrum sp.]